ncbi:GSK-3-binding protein [Frankliniella fusca]|uniref:GSK-3-binding protein n=1 Tax=Frankliniella fusca TaxID=407009 RepID=A0AAE1H323_9NEOP|nr:GSK-3-binding protein [Frankliniella fusca]
MPSIEETCVLSAASPTTATTGTLARASATAQPDFFARDMEELVSEIKENLRLSSGGLKSRPAFSVLHKSSRPSPYRIPSRSRSWGDPNCDACSKASTLCCGHSCKKSAKVTAESDDPYEMLQELLRDGGLIKEAVRRLSMGLSPKQRYFYDSDEDTPIRMCHVEL